MKITALAMTLILAGCASAPKPAPPPSGLEYKHLSCAEMRTVMTELDYEMGQRFADLDDKTDANSALALASLIMPLAPTTPYDMQGAQMLVDQTHRKRLGLYKQSQAKSCGLPEPIKPEPKAAPDCDTSAGC